VVWTGLIWIRIGTSGWDLVNTVMNLGIGGWMGTRAGLDVM
jgi:hypothetical protein